MGLIKVSKDLVRDQGPRPFGRIVELSNCGTVELSGINLVWDLYRGLKDLPWYIGSDWVILKHNP